MNFYGLRELVSKNENEREKSVLPFRQLVFSCFKTVQIWLTVGEVLSFSCQNLGYG